MTTLSTGASTAQNPLRTSLAYATEADLQSIARHLVKASTAPTKNALKKCAVSSWTLAKEEVIDYLATTDTKSTLSRATHRGFWLRKLRKQAKLDTAIAELPKIGKSKATVTGYMQNQRSDQLARNRSALEAYSMSCEGMSIQLSTIVDKSIANPQIRYFDIKQRLRGLAELARKDGLTISMETITCPPRMHPSADSYDGTTPKEAQAYLTAKWAKFRARAAKLSKYGHVTYGTRFVEAHKDGCPHWHVLMMSNNIDLVRDLLKDIFLLADDADPDAPGSIERRLRSDTISGCVNQIIAYCLPYMLKSIAGASDPDQAREKLTSDEKDGLTLEECATKADTWRSAWGIPSFKLFSVGAKMPTATQWRECRRESETTSLGAAALKTAAKGGKYRKFIELARKHELTTLHGDYKKTMYGDFSTSPEILGVATADEKILTHVKKWEKVKHEDDADLSEPYYDVVQGKEIPGFKMLKSTYHTNPNNIEKIERDYKASITIKENNYINHEVTVIEAKPRNPLKIWSELSLLEENPVQSPRTRPWSTFSEEEVQVDRAIFTFYPNTKGKHIKATSPWTPTATPGGASEKRVAKKSIVATPDYKHKLLKAQAEKVAKNSPSVGIRSNGNMGYDENFDEWKQAN